MNVTKLQCGCCLLLVCLNRTADATDLPWTMRAFYWADAELDALASTADALVERREYFVGYTRQFGDDSVAASYAHRPMLIEAGEPAHNGYFHQLDVAYVFSRGALSADVMIGVHSSSNMLKYGDFHDDALVASFSGNYLLTGQLGVGLNGDHRFGHFALYPTAVWSGGFGESHVEIEFPVALRWRRHDFSVAVERYGEKWAALDDSRSVESAFYLQEWRITASWQWPGGWHGLTPVLGVGLSLNTEVEYYDLAAGWIESDVEDAAFLFVEFKF